MPIKRSHKDRCLCVSVSLPWRKWSWGSAWQTQVWSPVQSFHRWNNHSKVKYDRFSSFRTPASIKVLRFWDTFTSPTAFSILCASVYLLFLTDLLQQIHLVPLTVSYLQFFKWIPCFIGSYHFILYSSFKTFCCSGAQNVLLHTVYFTLDAKRDFSRDFCCWLHCTSTSQLRLLELDK